MLSTGSTFIYNSYNSAGHQRSTPWSIIERGVQENGATTAEPNRSQKVQMIRLTVLALHVDGQVDQAVGVAPLVVIPRDKLDEVIVEGDTSFDVEDG